MLTRFTHCEGVLRPGAAPSRHYAMFAASALACFDPQMRCEDEEEEEEEEEGEDAWGAMSSVITCVKSWVRRTVWQAWGAKSELNEH
eukprot:1147864-Pelagomonas_calceolata.AAC.7